MILLRVVSVETREHILWDRSLRVYRPLQEVAHWVRRKSGCTSSAEDFNYFCCSANEEVAWGVALPFIFIQICIAPQLDDTVLIFFFFVEAKLRVYILIIVYHSLIHACAL